MLYYLSYCLYIVAHSNRNSIHLSLTSLFINHCSLHVWHTSFKYSPVNFLKCYVILPSLAVLLLSFCNISLKHFYIQYQHCYMHRVDALKVVNIKAGVSTKAPLRVSSSWTGTALLGCVRWGKELTPHSTFLFLLVLLVFSPDWMMALCFYMC